MYRRGGYEKVQMPLKSGLKAVTRAYMEGGVSNNDVQRWVIECTGKPNKDEYIVRFVDVHIWRYTCRLVR